VPRGAEQIESQVLVKEKGTLAALAKVPRKETNYAMKTIIYSPKKAMPPLGTCVTWSSGRNDARATFRASKSLGSSSAGREFGM
jgi:hypothetical protein